MQLFTSRPKVGVVFARVECKMSFVLEVSSDSCSMFWLDSKMEGVTSSVPSFLRVL